MALPQQNILYETLSYNDPDCLVHHLSVTYTVVTKLPELGCQPLGCLSVWY